MLDVAELLRVRRADGREVELTVDDIRADDSVGAAVNERLNSGPVGVIEPGQNVMIVARAFNRGWARFPLLDAGAFQAVLEKKGIPHEAIGDASQIALAYDAIHSGFDAGRKI